MRDESLTLKARVSGLSLSADWPVWALDGSVARVDWSRKSRSRGFSKSRRTRKGSEARRGWARRIWTEMGSFSRGGGVGGAEGELRGGFSVQAVRVRRSAAVMKVL
jgi:hypothetical protein